MSWPSQLHAQDEERRCNMAKTSVLTEASEVLAGCDTSKRIYHNSSQNPQSSALPIRIIFPSSLDACQRPLRLIVLHPEFQITVPEMDAGFRDWLPGSGCETSVFMFERKWGRQEPSLPLAGSQI